MRPTEDQIAAEVTALRQLANKVPRYNYFNEDNRAAIDAQIEVLEDLLDDDDIDERFADEAENVSGAASDAVSWLEGSLESTMSEGWSELVKE